MGSWVTSQRYNKGKLSKEQKNLLDSLGFFWDPRGARWDKGFGHLKAYVQEEGHAKVPSNFETVDRYELGSWVGVQRQKRGKLSLEQKKKLDTLGFIWDPKDAQWNKGFEHLNAYVQEEGHAKVPRDFEAVDGFKLGNWVKTQRRAKDRLTLARRKELESLAGWKW